MGVFHKCQFVLDFDATRVSYKVRQGLKNKILQHGGTIGYTVSRKTTHMVVDEGSRASFSYKTRKAQKLNIPIIGVSYIDDCLSSSRLVNPASYLIVDTQAQAGFGLGKIVGIGQKKDRKTVIRKRPLHVDLFSVKVYPWNSGESPKFPGEGGYHLARSVLLDSIKDEKSGRHIFYQLELHAAEKKVGERSEDEPDTAYRFRVFSHYGDLNDLKNEESGAQECRYLKTSAEAVDVFRQLYEQRIKPPWKMKRCKQVFSRWIGSPTFRRTKFEAGSLASDKLEPEVCAMVEQVWQEAVGQLTEILAGPMERVSLEKVEKGESLLLQLRESLNKNSSSKQIEELSQEYYSQIPHKKQLDIKTKQDITREQGICQLIRDIRSVSEATDWSVRGRIEAKYRTLRCHMELLGEGSLERADVVEHIEGSIAGNQSISVRRVFAISRFVEDANFTRHLGNQKLLFHASKPSSFLGILSRGLLMPRIVVDDLGGGRTDAGMLGHGIYFADSASTSAKYAARSGLSHTRFMVLCDVALGRSMAVTKYQPDLTCPPEGFDSVQGVGARAGDVQSDFGDNEFTIYNVDQQRLRYLVEFSLSEDETDGILPPPMPKPVPMETTDDYSSPPSSQPTAAPVDLKDVMAVPNPNDKVTTGLQTKGNKPIPLKKVFVKARMMDLAAQVVILQEYDNVNREPIEAKYVFPLEDSAAVCGFEAFIADKHIVGKVKEKEKAHKEYREAISKGHGAYLMDEEAPDVFTVSVGNLPPKVSVVIKITYVIELSVEGDKIAFNLPGSVAPWRKDSAMAEVTQKHVTTLKIKDSSPIFFSVAVSMEMAADITSIESPTHPLKIKQTSTKAVVCLPKDCTTLREGFQLLVGVADIHRPRMWVERDPKDNSSQACMLTFYPDFESTSLEKPEIILLLDCSNSMKEGPLKQAKQILLLALHHMPDDYLFNVVTFGTGFEELFPNSQAKTDATVQAATTFINDAQAVQGNTDAWRPLQTYFLLRSDSGLQNIFLVSDGHINNEGSTLNAIAQNNQHCRVFTFGVSASANKHLLKAMARVGCGAFEFFDSSAKSRWEKKVRVQLSRARQPSVSTLHVEWKQFDENPEPPVQAPNQLTALFSGSRLVVYGFVQHCTQACLKATIDGEEVSTLVSTPDLCITSGQIVHRLTARAVIRDWEEGTLDPDKTHHEAKKEEQKPYIIDLSKRYSIVTQLTSFVAVEEREKGEDLAKKGGVDVLKLAEKEDVDLLPYIDWQKTVTPDGETAEEVDPKKKVQDLLDKAKTESTFSVLRTEEFLVQAHDQARAHLPATTKLFIQATAALYDFLKDTKQEKDRAEEILLCTMFPELDRDCLDGESLILLKRLHKERMHLFEIINRQSSLCCASTLGRASSQPPLRHLDTKRSFTLRKSSMQPQKLRCATLPMGAPPVPGSLPPPSNVSSMPVYLKLPPPPPPGAPPMRGSPLLPPPPLGAPLMPESLPPPPPPLGATYMHGNLPPPPLAGGSLPPRQLFAHTFSKPQSELVALELSTTATGSAGHPPSVASQAPQQQSVMYSSVPPPPPPPPVREPLPDAIRMKHYSHDDLLTPICASPVYHPTSPSYELTAPSKSLSPDKCLLSPCGALGKAELQEIKPQKKRSASAYTRQQKDAAKELRKATTLFARPITRSRLPEVSIAKRSAMNMAITKHSSGKVQIKEKEKEEEVGDLITLGSPMSYQASASGIVTLDEDQTAAMEAPAPHSPKRSALRSEDMVSDEARVPPASMRFTTRARQPKEKKKEGREEVAVAGLSFGSVGSLADEQTEGIETFKRKKKKKKAVSPDDDDRGHLCAEEEEMPRMQARMERASGEKLQEEKEQMKRREMLEDLDDRAGALQQGSSQWPMIEEQSSLVEDVAADVDQCLMFFDVQDRFEPTIEDFHQLEVPTCAGEASYQDEPTTSYKAAGLLPSDSEDDDFGFSIEECADEDGSIEEDESTEERPGRELPFKRRGTARSRSRSRSRRRVLEGEDEAKSKDETDFLSKTCSSRAEVYMWVLALATGTIPDSFPGMEAQELAGLKIAVNAYLSTLQPFSVPVIVDPVSLPNRKSVKALLKGLDKMIDLQEEFPVMLPSDFVEELTTAASDTSLEREIDNELSLFRHVHPAKFFAFIKNAGIHSLGLKMALKIIVILFVAMVIAVTERLWVQGIPNKLKDFVQQDTHLVRELDIARTSSWMQVAELLIEGDLWF